MQKPANTASTWSLDRTPLESIDLQRVHAREDLFYLVTAASFIESGSDLYTRNLIHYCAGEAELVGWLQDRWEQEEMRHGRALHAYVRHVWPEFDWDRAYAAFFEDYSRQCTLDEFESTPGLEMVARCVIETGTATFYQALAEQARAEPVLSGIATRIRADEIDHYKHFYHYFRNYRAGQAMGRWGDGAMVRARRSRPARARSPARRCGMCPMACLLRAPARSRRRQGGLPRAERAARPATGAPLPGLDGGQDAAQATRLANWCEPGTARTAGTGHSLGITLGHNTPAGVRFSTVPWPPPVGPRWPW